MGAAAGPDIVTDGLVLCLDAANNQSYPGTGTTWTDLSGNGNDGTLVNGVGYNPANNGSLVFDGSNDYINLDNFVPVLNMLTYSTECYWFKIEPTVNSFLLSWFGNRYNPIGNFTSGSAAESISIYAFNIRAYYENGHQFYSDNIWHYACYVYGNGFNKIYVDGESLPLRYTVGDSTTTRSAYSASNFRIANRTTDFFADGGEISNVKIYNRALSEAEIQQNYAATRGRYGV